MSKIVYHQPQGIWIQRQAETEFMEIALNKIPHKIPLTSDKCGYNFWHYWANSTEPELTWSTIRQSLGQKLDLSCALNGSHPLHYLLLCHKTKATTLWCQQAKFPQNARMNTDTYWHTFAWAGQIDNLKQNASYFSTDTLQEHDEQGYTPLCIAFHRGGFSLAQEFIFLGADPNVTDFHHRTLLHHVALYGDIDLFLRIQDLGAEDNIKDDKGMTPLSLLNQKIKTNQHSDIHNLNVYWTNKYNQKLFF